MQRENYYQGGATVTIDGQHVADWSWQTERGAPTVFFSREPAPRAKQTVRDDGALTVPIDWLRVPCAGPIDGAIVDVGELVAVPLARTVQLSDSPLPSGQDYRGLVAALPAKVNRRMGISGKRNPLMGSDSLTVDDAVQETIIKLLAGAIVVRPESTPAQTLAFLAGVACHLLRSKSHTAVAVGYPADQTSIVGTNLYLRSEPKRNRWAEGKPVR